MKTTIQKIKLRLIMMVAVLMIGFAAFADDPDPLEDDPGVPIDGGISLLIAAGVGYGAKKVHDARRKKNNTRK